MEKESGFSKLPLAVQKGLKKALVSDKPFLLSPFTWAAGKAVGSKKVDDFVFKTLQKPIASADIALGSVAQKGLDKLTGGSGKFFKDKVLLDTGKAGKSLTGSQQHSIPSILAPAKRLGGFVVPLAGTIKLEEMYQKAKGKDMENKIIKKAELQKTAEMLISLRNQRNTLEKRAKATELLYKQAELGQIKFPKTLEDYNEKVAALLSKDLNVVEEAIKMASSTEESDSIGGLGDGQTKVGNAHDAFASIIIDQ